ncbi:MAG TPA: DUF4386 domain-containing protein [Allosphingosinicella sp.]|nr:DUF4386 domain-containing protein [Allosphingosinicella sp.]
MARTPQAYARLAGALYLGAMILYVAPLLVFGGLDVPGDFARTARNIASSEASVRVALGSQLLGFVAIALLAWAFYMLLAPVERALALLGLLFRMVEAVLMALGNVLWFVALKNYTEADGGAFVDRLLTAGINSAFQFAMICSSIGSLLFFFLLFRSRMIPRLLAGFDMGASTLALLFAFALLLVPGHVAALGMAGWRPIFLAETATGL